MTRKARNILRLLEAEKDNLFQYAGYRLHNIRDVEDALQNLYLKILDRPERFEKVTNKKAYIYRMLCNECTDIQRHDNRINSLEGNSLDEAAEIVTLMPENFEEEFDIINKLLNLLPREQSECIRLRHHGNLSFQEIADTMNVSLPAAKARYRYGIEKIRTKLKSMNLL